MAEAFREEGRDHLADIFQDGVVNADDYESAFETFSSCLTSRGYEVAQPVLNPADGLRYIASFRADGKREAELERDRQECGADFSEVEAMYTATNEQTMDAELRATLITCMAERDLEVDSEARNYPEIVQSGSQSDVWHIGVAECLGEAREKLYPDLPHLPVGF